MLCGCTYHGNVAQGVTPDKLIRVRFGMTFVEVVRLLGPPMSVEEEVGENTWRNVVTAQYPPSGKVVLNYSHHVYWGAPHLQVFVVFHNGRVFFARVNDRGPFGFGGGGVYDNPGRNDSERPWNSLVAERNRKKALADLYRDFGEHVPDTDVGSGSPQTQQR